MVSHAGLPPLRKSCGSVEKDLFSAATRADFKKEFAIEQTKPLQQIYEAFGLKRVSKVTAL